GGSAASARNLLSGNGRAGVFINSTSTGNDIQNNLIGTNIAGTAAIPNNAGIILSDAPANTIGGTTAATRNVVSGNSVNGIQIGGLSGGNTISGNFVGTNAAGTAALGNGVHGIVINDSPNNTVGGATAGERNI